MMNPSIRKKFLSRAKALHRACGQIETLRSNGSTIGTAINRVYPRLRRAKHRRISKKTLWRLFAHFRANRGAGPEIFIPKYVIPVSRLGPEIKREALRLVATEGTSLRGLYDAILRAGIGRGRTGRRPPPYSYATFTRAFSPKEKTTLKEIFEARRHLQGLAAALSTKTTHNT